MTSDLDIYRTANVLIREHGEEAALEAAQLAAARQRPTPPVAPPRQTLIVISPRPDDGKPGPRFRGTRGSRVTRLLIPVDALHTVLPTRLDKRDRRRDRSKGGAGE